MRRRPSRDLQAAATRLCQRALPVQGNVFGTALLVVSLVLVGANRLLTVRAGLPWMDIEKDNCGQHFLFLVDATLDARE